MLLKAGFVADFDCICSICQPSTESVSMPKGRQTVTLVPGDGVGPEIMSSVKDVFTAAGVPVDFEELFLR